MRKSVLIVILLAGLFASACSGGAEDNGNRNVPELLKAVPSDALCVGVFARCDHALGRMTDSLSVLRSLDFGRLSRSHAVYALCDIGSVEGLLLLDAGRSGADTLEAAKALMHQTDSMSLASALVSTGTHDALLVSTSPTVVKVAVRHLSSGSSILDAPEFSSALEFMDGPEAVAFRCSGAPKLYRRQLPGLSGRQSAGFLKNSAVWIVSEGGRLHPVSPSGGSYFSNFYASLQDGQSQLRDVFPEGSDAVIDIPLASLSAYRQAYENWLDASVALEPYRKRLGALQSASGKNPLAWEKELGVCELVSVTTREGRINMLRTSRRQDGAPEPVANKYTGFASALYGSVFEPSDSLVLHVGSWLVSSGSRRALDSLRTVRCKAWPAKARVTVQSGSERLSWTKENIKIWDSNQ